MENLYNSISPQKENRPKSNFAKPTMDRRAFLKGLAAVTASAAIERFLPKDMPAESSLAEEIISPDIVLEEISPEKNADEIPNEELESIGKTFQEQLHSGQEKIILDSATRKAIFEYWLKKYAPGTINYQEGILSGLEIMRPWIREIRSIFQKYQVPEKYIYLAIAESHFKTNASSKAGAVGPYQITSKTATLFSELKLKMGDLYDERRDPLKSAELCAKHLRYSYEKFGNNWDLALLDYNGGYTKGFIDYTQKQELHTDPNDISIQGNYQLQTGETLSQIAAHFETSLTLLYRKNALPGEIFFEWMDRMKKIQPGEILVIPQKRIVDLEGFYAWIEIEINKKITDELSKNFYVVKNGETLSAIAKKFHMDINLLKSLNEKVSSRSLQSGQKMHIPSLYRKRSDVLMQILAGFKENINYPEKFYAILKIIEDNHLDPADNSLGKRFLEIPIRKPASLKDISINRNLSLQDIQNLNPAIKNSVTKLPIGIKIRVPNSHLIANLER